MIPEEKLIKRLQRMADDLGRPPTSTEMEKDGPHSSTTYQNRFGGWNAALRAADLPVSKESGLIETECDNCGSPLKRYRYQIDDGELNFCDSACMGEYQESRYAGSGNPRYSSKVKPCDYCGADIEVAPWEERASERHYCDMVCRSNHRSESGSLSGENNPRYRHGEASYGAGWSDKKKETVRERYGRKCAGCGCDEPEHQSDAGSRLDVHHVVPARDVENVEYRNCLDNLVPLCNSCHSKVFHIEPLFFPVITREAFT